MNTNVINGQANSYTPVAENSKTTLAVSLQYQAGGYPERGFLLFRVVLIPKNSSEQLNLSIAKGLTTFKRRKLGKFVENGSEYSVLRVAKMAISIFSPAPPPIVFLLMADKFMIWELVADWVKERVLENGFTPVDDLQTLLRACVSGEGHVDDGYSLTVEFPNLEQKV